MPFTVGDRPSLSRETKAKKVGNLSQRLDSLCFVHGLPSTPPYLPMDGPGVYNFMVKIRLICPVPGKKKKKRKKKKKKKRAGSSVDGASDWKSRSSTQAGSSPRCGKGFFSQNHLPMQTLLLCPRTAAFVHATTACNPKHWQPYQCLDTLAGSGSAALLPYPGKATRTLCKGQWSTKKKKKKKKQDKN